METQVAVDIGGDGPAGEAPPVRKRRRRRVRIAVLAVVVVIAGGLSWFLAYGATYQPLTPGDGSGSPTGAAKVITDGLSDTAVIIEGPKGSKGSFTLSLANQGSHPVRILGLPSYETGGGFSVAWEPSPNGGVPSGEKPRSFPVTISAGQQILLVLSITQPQCPKDGGEYSDLPLRWEALGWHHVYDLQFTGGTDDNFLPIAVCPPASALRYIDKNA